VSARPPWVRVGLIAALVLAADQVSKALVDASIALGDRRHVIGGVLSLVHAQNSGVAFSLLSGSEAIVVVVTLVIVGAVLAFFATHVDMRLLWLATGLIVGGALGNLLDRIRTGSVTDFIQLPHWPAFNVSDIAITFGVLTLLWVLERRSSQ
jgi:signal peptidase II